MYIRYRGSILSEFFRNMKNRTSIFGSLSKRIKKEYKDSTYLGGFLDILDVGCGEGVRAVRRLSRSGHSEQ